MAEAVDELITLDNKTYRQIIRLAKSYRKSNALAEKLFGEKAEIKFTGSFEIVSKLILLEAGSFKIPTPTLHSTGSAVAILVFVVQPNNNRLDSQYLWISGVL